MQHSWFLGNSSNIFVLADVQRMWMLFLNNDVPRFRRCVFPFFRGGDARKCGLDFSSGVNVGSRSPSKSKNRTTRNVRRDRIAVCIARYLRVSISRRARKVCDAGWSSRELLFFAVMAEDGVDRNFSKPCTVSKYMHAPLHPTQIVRRVMEEKKLDGNPSSRLLLISKSDLR